MFLLSTLIVSGIVIITLYPFAAATAAIPIPVLPDVGSIIVAPGLSFPLSSASSIIFNAILSLTLPAGLKYSNLAKILASVMFSFASNFLTSNKGVFPISSAALVLIFAIFISSNFNCFSKFLFFLLISCFSLLIFFPTD